MKLIVALCLLVSLTNISYAQDHYWSQQYGGQATLMGGTSVVGASDNSSIYYNPGGIGFIDSARITVSTYIYGLEYANLKNGAGSGVDLKSLRVNIIPQLLAASIKIKKVPRLRLLFGTVTRGRTDMRFTGENENNYEVINGSPDTEHYQARLDYSYSSLEQWAGWGLAYKINEHWSVGLSSFITYTHMDVRSTENVNTEAVSNGLTYTATVNEYNAIRLDQFMHVLKIGASAHFKHVQIGAALTTPGVKIWGEGKLEKSFEVYNLNKNPSDTTITAQKHDSYIISDVQTRLKSHYKIPLSASLGIKLVYPAFNISFAVEYFMGYKTQIILGGADRIVVRPALVYGNDTVKGFMQLQTAASFVLNGGIGAEVKLTPHVNLLLGVRTDFSNHTEYLPNNSVISVLSAKSPVWDYLFISAGFKYKLALHNLTVGFDYGIGINGNRQQLYNLTEPKQGNFLRGYPNGDMKTSAHKLSFILSYTYFFKAKEKNYGPYSIIEELRMKKKKSPVNKKTSFKKT